MSDERLAAGVDDLQATYVRALAKRDMQAWAACFGDPASYLCTARESEEQRHGIAIMMDDSLARIRDRVKFVTEVWKGTFEDYYCRHFVQRVLLERGREGVLTVESNLLVAYTDSRGRSGVLASGVYLDEITMSPAGARFRSKRVILDTAVTPRYLVYPL